MTTGKPISEGGAIALPSDSDVENEYRRRARRLSFVRALRSDCHMSRIPRTHRFPIFRSGGRLAGDGHGFQQVPARLPW